MIKKTWGVLFIALLSVFAVAAQTADEIINKSLEARGGTDKLKALQSVVMEGIMNQAGTDINMTITVVNNKGAKVEFSVQGQTGYTIVTPTDGWTYNPFTGASSPEKMGEEQLKESQVQLDLPGPFVDYKNKGIKADYAGKEAVAGKECFKVKLTRANGKSSTYYFDSGTYYVIRIVGTNIVNGSEMEVTTDYADFRKTPEGYIFPFKRIVGQGEINFNKIEINPKVDDAVFKPNN
jgi:outer membrane lipoprotein-sorting protein